MATTDHPFARFEDAYQAVLSQLAAENPNDDALDALAFIEEASRNSGTADHSSEWIDSFAAVSALLLTDAGAALDETAKSHEWFTAYLADAIAHAVRLGYTEGYFAAQED